MSRAEFNACSPAEVHELVQAWRDRERRWDWRFAASIVFESRGKDDPPLRLVDLFPSLAPPEGEEPDAGDLEAKLDAWERAHNARARRR